MALASGQAGRARTSRTLGRLLDRSKFGTNYARRARWAVQEDSNTVTIAPIQSRMARVALSWGVRDLAAAAKVSPNTVARLERGETLNPRTLGVIRAALEAAGIEFIPQNGGGGVGVRLKAGQG